MNEIIVHDNINQDLIDKYNRYLPSENTSKRYMNAIVKFFNKRRMTDITIEDIKSVDPDIAMSWASDQLKKGRAKSSINNDLAALKNFYGFLCMRHIKLVDYNPFDEKEGCRRFKQATKNYSDQKTLVPEELQLMIDFAGSKNGLEGVRNKIIIELLSTTGLRREELVDIKIGDIQETYGTHIIEIIGKGEKHRQVLLIQDVYDHIQDYLSKRNLTFKDKNLPLFTSHSSNSIPNSKLSVSTVYRVVKTSAARAGIDPDLISPHTVRHTFATQAYMIAGEDVKTIQDMLGHASSTTTQRYINATKSITSQAAQKIYDAMTKPQSK